MPIEGKRDQKNGARSFKLQSSFELLIMLAFGLSVLIPIVVFAFIQISNANSSLAAIGAQQAASKLASTATLVGSEGSPAKQIIQVYVPAGVQYIYVGTLNNGIGHVVVFEVRSAAGLSYITAYTPQNITGNLNSVASSGTYLINVSAQSSCPFHAQIPCVYISPVV